MQRKMRLTLVPAVPLHRRQARIGTEWLGSLFMTWTKILFSGLWMGHPRARTGMDGMGMELAKKMRADGTRAVAMAKLHNRRPISPWVQQA